MYNITRCPAVDQPRTRSKLSWRYAWLPASCVHSRHARSARVLGCRRRCGDAWMSGNRLVPRPNLALGLQRNRNARASIRSSRRLDSNPTGGGAVGGETATHLRDEESQWARTSRLRNNADRGDLFAFSSFETSVHELPRHNRTPFLDPALERSKLSFRELAGVVGSEPCE
jgi:hypothetical protein